MANRTLTWPVGFRVAAVAAGIKASGTADLGLIVGDEPCTAAGVFTQNKVVGAAVAVSREHLKARRGRGRAIFVNAGNANTCTGKRGLKDARRICGYLANAIHAEPEDVLICSTGIIGHFLPMDRVRAGISEAAEQLAGSERMGTRLSRAIMTTDTKPKTTAGEVVLPVGRGRLAGIAKGAGMIAPNMATMLGFFTTDIAITPTLLQRALSEAVTVTFNKVSIDNHTSTSDTVLVLASGRAGHPMIRTRDAAYQRFCKALHKACDDLARQIAADGEGATMAVTIRVTGAASAGDATLAVRAIADSPLVRCAFNGADPNWGRVISAVGYSGARFDPEQVTCRMAGVTVFRNGRPARFDPAALATKMKARDWTVEVNLAVGNHEDFCYSCDLSRDYVAINADYHT